jgi:Photosynthesis system II assembly factor YCF48
MKDVPKIVRERLQRARSAPAESHPDADLLTAFTERSLAAVEQENVVKHLVHCGECREIVMLALPEAETLVSAPVGSRTRANWLRWPALRWAAVAAGILVVTSVGVLQFRQREGRTQIATRLASREQLASAEQRAPVSPATSPAPTSAPPSAPPSVQVGKHMGVEKKAAAAEQSTPTVDKPVTANAVFPRSNQVRGGIAGGIGSGSGMAFGGPVRREVTSINGLPPASVGESSTAKSNSSVPSTGEAVEVSGAAPLVQTETVAENATRELARNQSSDTLQLSGRQTEAVVRAKPTLAQPAPGIAAPGLQKDSTVQNSPAPRWTISASGALQGSLDGGKTWLSVNLAADSYANSNLMAHSQSEMATVMPAQTRSAKRAGAKSAPAPPVPVIFRALSVSSNAAEVWAGGAAGVLYHTMDGGDLWVRVVPSDGGVALSGDIVSIEFPDTRNGTVTTLNATVWTTNDNGQSWHKQP